MPVLRFGQNVLQFVTDQNSNLHIKINQRGSEGDELKQSDMLVHYELSTGQITVENVSPEMETNHEDN